MLSVNQLTFKVKNKTLIDELTLNVTPGSFYALLGRKGSGKTTLLRLCSGLLEPQSGNIYINGMDVSKRENKKNIIRILGYMGSQDGYFPRLQVMEYLEVYAHAQGLYGLAARERCMEVLQMGHLERRAEQLVEELLVSEENFPFCGRLFIVRACCFLMIHLMGWRVHKSLRWRNCLLFLQRMR